MKQYPFSSKEYAFGVCRIERENNIHLILEAFSQGVKLPLVMVGNWQQGKYGKDLKQKYSGMENFFLLDPIYDQTELNELRAHCKIYLHGHSCGGTNPSLVEAMCLGLPIAAFDVNFNKETTEGKALYFNSPEDLREIVASVSHETLKTIGEHMREIAERRYTWSRIARLYAELF